MLKIGDPAPDFSLYDSGKNKIILSELKGQNVLLLFFPVAFTRICTQELCSIRDNIGLYDKSDAKVLGISIDSLYTLAKFKEEQQYNFPLLSDFNKTASTAYGSLYETWNYDMKGVSKRSAFVVDKEGIIRYAEILENASLEPDYEKIAHTLAEINKI
ncbi:MAG: redoxin domain-containing protein [Chitinophagaceae bacterium]